MAIFMVTTALDVVNAGDGVLSLREAVQRANATGAPDTIVFANALEGRTLTLTQGQLTLSEDVTIDGDRDGRGPAVTIDGNQNDRVLQIAGSDTEVDLADLILANGRPADRGPGGNVALGAGARLTLDGCTVEGSSRGLQLVGQQRFLGAREQSLHYGRDAVARGRVRRRERENRAIVIERVVTEGLG